jgi:hypothetical protein
VGELDDMKNESGNILTHFAKNSSEKVANEAISKLQF